FHGRQHRDRVRQGSLPTAIRRRADDPAPSPPAPAPAGRGRAPPRCARWNREISLVACTPISRASPGGGSMTGTTSRITDDLLHRALAELAAGPDADILLADVIRAVDSRAQVGRR